MQAPIDNEPIFLSLFNGAVNDLMFVRSVLVASLS